MEDTLWQQRTRLLIGESKMEKLRTMHVLVVGLGGVGAYSAEQLCRAGVGEMTIIDADTVENSNRNRQLLALTSTIGKAKTEVMAERLQQINPNVIIHPICEFIRDERTIEILQQAHYDYVIDAIDSLSPKVFLIYHALKQHLKIVSVMGAGGKIDPSQIRIADIQDSYQCRLARAIRKRLHKLGIYDGFTVVFSPESVAEEAVVIDSAPENNKLSTVGTISYMPAIFGCMAASVVLRDAIG